MNGGFKLNGHSTGYLIHGQLFIMDYAITSCLFVIIYSKGNGLKLKRASGQYAAISNAYKPTVRFWAIGIGFRQFKHVLKVNFINTKIGLPEILYPTVKRKANMTLNAISVLFQNKTLQTIVPEMKAQTEFNINNQFIQDSYTTIKQAKNDL